MSSQLRDGRVYAIIPARYGSTRFPGKPLAKIGSKTMVRWTYESSSQSKLLDKIIVATDDERIVREVESWGGNVVMTSPTLATGTDRILEATRKLGKEITPERDIIINIQGDEPAIEAELIDGVVELKKKHPEWEVTTAATPFYYKEAQDPNRVKVVVDNQGKALYFSRALIPYPQKEDNPLLSEKLYFRHIGIYCFNADFLLMYDKLPASHWENLESLEQLRILQAGYSIGVYEAARASLAVDHPEDIQPVEELLRSRGLLD